MQILASPDKKELRRTLRARRDAVGETARIETARAVCEILLDRLPEVEGTIAVYTATPRELSLAPFMEVALWRNWKLAAPSGDAFVRLDSDGELTNEQTATENIAFFLVPGIGFDASGTRIGQGGGWYDRALQNTSGIFVGIAFDEQIEERLPRESHDVAMHFVCTPTRWISCATSTVEFRLPLEERADTQGGECE